MKKRAITSKEIEKILKNNPEIRIKGMKPVKSCKIPANTRGMNGLESRYTEHLEKLKLAGEIKHFGFETYKLRLANNTTYTPDFFVIRNDDTLEFHETKGFMRPQAAVKLKTTAELFPHHIFRLVKQEKKTMRWIITVIPPHTEGE